MPKKPINYQNAVIYKIHCKNPEIMQVYIGSTTEFTKRKNQHKSKCNNENNKDHYYPVYKFIRENGSWDNWFMTEVEKYPCNDKRELEKREREVMLENGFNNCLNKRQPTRTKKENYQDNKEEHLKKRKEYRDTYKEKINEKRKIKVTCACGFILRQDSLPRHERSKRHKDIMDKKILEKI